MTLTDFLLARIAEDEAAARDTKWLALEYGVDSVGRNAFSARVLADCAAKRLIVEHCQYDDWSHPDHRWIGEPGEGRLGDVLANPRPALRGPPRLPRGVEAVGLRASPRRCTRSGGGFRVSGATRLCTRLCWASRST